MKQMQATVCTLAKSLEEVVPTKASLRKAVVAHTDALTKKLGCSLVLPCKKMQKEIHNGPNNVSKIAAEKTVGSESFSAFRGGI